MPIKEKLIKVYELACRGIGGEKVNAEKILKKMLKENGMTLADLELLKSEKKERTFIVLDKDLDDLLGYIVMKVLEVSSVEYKTGTGKSRFKRYYELTDEQFIRVSMLWEVYSRAFKRERTKLKKRQKSERFILFKAFVLKHKLYNRKRTGSSDRHEKPEDIEEVLRQIREMEDVPFREELPGRMLEAGK